MAQPTEILSRTVLSRGFGLLEQIVFRRKRRDGATGDLTRELFETGDGATILPYDPSRGTIILIRQFRAVAFLKQGHDTIIEACAGKLEGADPLTRIVKETEEETGIHLTSEPVRLFECYSSPGSYFERLTYFVAPYKSADRRSAGGGLVEEGEDIEVLEMTLDEAVGLVETGKIIDAKTIILIYYAKTSGLLRQQS